ncbi:MAG: sulfatase-like hydrolase/transferase [Actinomycetota bacterium]
MTNVLVLMGDEHQARALGCADHPVVQTPNLDHLAARGTRFTNAWTPSPICVPARASFATGRWVHEVGTWDSAHGWTGEPAGWPHAARDAGYEVTSIGKLHHRAASDDDGFTERVLPMYIAGGVGWLQGLPRRDPLPYDEADELARDVGSGETAYTRYDRRVTDAAVDWLGAPARQSNPWCAFVSWVAPHYPLSAPDEFTALYPLVDVPPPEIPRQPIDHAAVQAMADFFSYDRWFDDDLTRRGRQAYFALCSWLDHNVGRVLDALEASGQAEDTLVIYTSDHGEMAGNRGLWCKSFMYRDSVDVPMILAGPGVPRGALVTDEVSLVDVAATVSNAASLNPPPGPSRDLVSVAVDGARARIGFSEYHDGGSITGSFAVRFGEWKYIEHVGHPSELYNIANDPDELRNLAAESGNDGLVRRGAEALRSIVAPEQADRRAFASQERLLAEHGGREGVAQAFRFNHTPAP